MSAFEILWQAHAVLLLFSSLGFGCLALAMIRHQEELLGQAMRPSLARRLRAFGWLMLMLALAVAVSSMGWGFGLVAYSGHASAAAGLVFVALLCWDRIRNKRCRSGLSPPE